MKDLGKMLLQSKPFSEIVIGNTAIVRAMIESQTKVVTSYPGSPTPEIATAIKAIPRAERPFYFEFSTNEKVATEVAFGASINGHAACVFFKSVGLNVAADSFVQLSLMKLQGGMVIVWGDDPGANSSQNEQDNMHYARLSYIPVLEPANPQEVYQMYLEAMRLSQEMEMPVILRLTTHVCHAKQKVKFAEYLPATNYDDSPRFDGKSENYIPITSKVFPMKKRALQRLQAFQKLANQHKFNYQIEQQNSDFGIISMGVPHLSLLDTLAANDFEPDILKIGIRYPFPDKLVLEFLKNHRQVKILEELDDTLERDVKVLAYENQLSTKIIGKSDLEDWLGEYTPQKVAEVLHRCWPQQIAAPHQSPEKPLIAPRPAQMCPGCGHRSAFYAVKKALDKDDITVAGIGCHTLGFLPPYQMGEVLLCMGHSSGTAAGLSLFNQRRQVVAFVGDSTLFHAAMPSIVNAVFNQHNFTLVVMENGTTAMTGHQDHPASGHNFNEVTEKIPVKNLLQGLGVAKIWEVDTYNQKKLTEYIKESNSYEGFSVVIAKHPCMLKFDRQQRRKPDYIAKKVQIDQAICKQINECVSEFACPSFQREADGKVWVNHDLCIGDGSCLQTCPITAIKFEQGDKK
ncbi:MAG: thiamine pyrophosphate-dependent enzyme [Candidatus Cloacimonadales bacterium]